MSACQFVAGASPSGKALGFDPSIRRFESCRPSHLFVASVLTGAGVRKRARCKSGSLFVLVQPKGLLPGSARVEW